MNFVRLRQAITNRIVPNANNRHLLVGRKPLHLFTPLDLFTGGVQGAFYDFSDITKMFQDAAGTIPVTAPGQPVGRINDSSPNGWTLTQTAASFRPTYIIDGNGKPCLQFIATNFSCLNTAVQSMNNSINMFSSCAILKNSVSTARAQVYEYSPISNSTDGTFSMRTPTAAATDEVQFLSRGNITINMSATSFVTPIRLVLSGQARTGAANALLDLRVNGTLRATSNASQGAVAYSNQQLFVGSRAGTSEFFNGNLYGLVITAKQVSPGEITATESYLNAKVGAY